MSGWTGTVIGVDLRNVLRGVGKTFITSGMLILLFVAYELWGTGIAEARSQHSLRKQFEASLNAPKPTTPPTTGTTLPDATTTTADPLPPPPVGGALAIIRIPKAGINAAVVEGVDVSDLKKGPGHYPKTPLPGQPGNTAIAGHRTTYGAPFYHLDEVQPGDPIFISTRDGTFQYSVVSQHDVSPDDVAVINPTKDNRLTLTTCTPRFTAQKRLVVVAALIGPATAPPTRPAQPVRDNVTPSASAGAGANDTVGSLSGQSQSRWPAVGWGLLCALIWVVGYVMGRKWRRWPAYLVTAPFFLLALFVFFENFARFVPANI
jgi:sortase A